jgi:hypothetical protein
MKKKYSERLSKLKDNSVWVFTKQETDFDEAFKAAKLFSEITNIKKTNIEDYFRENHLRYGIKTDRHRTLVMSQLYGLITKTPFYDKVTQYKNERNTEVFYKISQYNIGSQEYNKLKTEQIIKLKIRAIIDTAGNNTNYKILPVIFVYQVLKKLKNEYGIKSLRKDMLLTYVMTASDYSEIDEVVFNIASNAAPYPNIEKYSDSSRILTAIKNNINLFIVTSEDISINKAYEEYFEQKYLINYEIEEIYNNTKSNLEYANWLMFEQGFDINLIDSLNIESSQNRKTDNLKEITTYDDKEDRDYVDRVDSIKEDTINIDVANESHKLEPTVLSNPLKGRRIKLNPIIGKISIIKANYSCEYSTDHKTFLSKRNGKNFMEGHHLIPVSKQLEIWDKFKVNIDCVDNVVSLCPNCHRGIHLGDLETKKELIKKLFLKKQNKLNSLGINLTLEELQKMYDVF